MSNIQKRLNSLKPYVVGIRFHDGLPLVDTVLKQDWNIPKSNEIQFLKSDESNEYFMFFTQNENYGVDEILDFIEKIINLNIERENKNLYFKQKVEELKTFFKKHSLSQLFKMKFVLGDDYNEENLDDISLTDDNKFNLPQIHKTSDSVTNEENSKPIIETKEQLKEVFDEKPVFKENMSEEEREEEEAIAKAAAFRKKQELDKTNGNITSKNNTINKHKNIELPPKINDKTECDCGDGLDKFCDICMERKGL